MLPSSQSSAETQRVSPKIGVLTVGAVKENVQPGSLVIVIEHPSKGVKFESSHCSLPTTSPSPEISVHTVGGVTLKIQPGSLCYVDEQPSSLIIF